MGNANGAISPRRKRSNLAPEAAVTSSHSDSSLSSKKGSKKKDKDERPKKSTSDRLASDSPPPSPSLAPPPIDPEKQLFGVPLELSALRSDPVAGTVPFPLKHTIEYLEKNCMSVEGLYRIPGKHSKIQEYIYAFNSGSKSVYGQNEDTHAVAGVLKAFLRELPESIFTDQLKPEFKKAGDIFVAEQRNKKIRMLLGSLPAVNRETVKVIYEHFSHVAAKSAENKMTASNLTNSICPDVGVVSTYLIEGFEPLFTDLPVKRIKSQSSIIIPTMIKDIGSNSTPEDGSFRFDPRDHRLDKTKKQTKVQRSGSLGGVSFPSNSTQERKEKALTPLASRKADAKQFVYHYEDEEEEDEDNRDHDSDSE
eukprot:TRINITY_DN3544_c0_g1_i4.p1 TRINITY_DN3544_c0_g1~~TRINITY_DN3544_c0_g1_i4.p1  ORF type:complete len:365 (-),score=89.86 TRINITY_DN3544_c0_g1_i4:329-1423(-)